MQVPRVTVLLERTEAQALVHMAEVDCRHPRDELRWLLVREARERGLLPGPPEPQPAEAEEIDSVEDTDLSGFQKHPQRSQSDVAALS
jgi:hypothetical protein